MAKHLWNKELYILVPKGHGSFCSPQFEGGLETKRRAVIEESIVLRIKMALLLQNTVQSSAWNPFLP